MKKNLRRTGTRRVILMDEEGEYETFGQIWAEFYTDAPNGVIQDVIKLARVRNPPDNNYSQRYLYTLDNRLEAIQDDIISRLKNMGYEVDYKCGYDEFIIRYSLDDEYLEGREY